MWRARGQDSGPSGNHVDDPESPHAWLLSLPLSLHQAVVETHARCTSAVDCYAMRMLCDAWPQPACVRGLAYQMEGVAQRMVCDYISSPKASTPSAGKARDDGTDCVRQGIPADLQVRDPMPPITAVLPWGGGAYATPM